MVGDGAEPRPAGGDQLAQLAAECPSSVRRPAAQPEYLKIEFRVSRTLFSLSLLMLLMVRLLLRSTVPQRWVADAAVPILKH
jgi:hypothetical protein